MTRMLAGLVLFAIAGVAQESRGAPGSGLSFAATPGVKPLVFGEVTSWPLSTLVIVKPATAELAALLPLVVAYQSQYLSQRIAEAAFEMKAGTKESKRPLQERFDAAKKLADEAMAKVLARVAIACADRKWKNCALVVPVDDPGASELRGEKQ